jgi:hypothetical protein
MYHGIFLDCQGVRACLGLACPFSPHAPPPLLVVKNQVEQGGAKNPWARAINSAQGGLAPRKRGERSQVILLNLAYEILAGWENGGHALSKGICLRPAESGSQCYCAALCLRRVCAAQKGRATPLFIRTIYSAN